MKKIFRVQTVRIFNSTSPNAFSRKSWRSPSSTRKTPITPGNSYFISSASPWDLKGNTDMNRKFFCCCFHAHHPQVAERQTMHLTVGVTQGEPS